MQKCNLCILQLAIVQFSGLEVCYFVKLASVVLLIVDCKWVTNGPNVLENAMELFPE